PVSGTTKGLNIGRLGASTRLSPSEGQWRRGFVRRSYSCYKGTASLLLLGFAVSGLVSCRKTGERSLYGPAVRCGPVAELVGIEGGVVSGVFNLESSGVEAPDRRPRHEEHYHEA